jgi:hypothetical protein
MATPVLVDGFTGVLATPLFVRGPSCDLVGYHIYNPSNATAFVHFYDSTAAPSVGTTVSVWAIGIPTLEQAFMTFPVAGLFFRNGLWVAATTTDSGSTPPNVAINVNLAVNP